MNKEITVKFASYEDAVKAYSAVDMAIRSLAAAQNIFNADTRPLALDLRRVADEMRKQILTDRFTPSP